VRPWVRWPVGLLRKTAAKDIYRLAIVTGFLLVFQAMPTKKKSEPVPAKVPKTKARRRKPVAQPVAVPEPAPKTLMQRIFESQREELERMNEEIQKKVLET
jgi:hypothetical protein